MLKLSKQKNALIGGLLGGVGGGQLVLELLDAYTNVHLDAHEAALVAGAVSTLVLLAGRGLTYLLTNGVAGAWQRIVHGKAGAQPHDVGGAPGGVTIHLGGDASAFVKAMQYAETALALADLKPAELSPGPAESPFRAPADESDPGAELDEHAAPPGPLPSTQP